MAPTSSIDKAEDREQFQQLVNDLDLMQPANAVAPPLKKGCKGLRKLDIR